MLKCKKKLVQPIHISFFRPSGKSGKKLSNSKWTIDVKILGLPYQPGISLRFGPMGLLSSDMGKCYFIFHTIKKKKSKVLCFRKVFLNSSSDNNDENVYCTCFPLWKTGRVLVDDYLSHRINTFLCCFVFLIYH